MKKDLLKLKEERKEKARSEYFNRLLAKSERAINYMNELVDNYLPLIYTDREKFYTWDEYDRRFNRALKTSYWCTDMCEKVKYGI